VLRNVSSVKNRDNLEKFKMSQLKGLVFDVDGTLADTERDGHRVAFNKAFSKAGLDWNWTVELYGELLEVTGGKERIKFYIDSFLKEFSYSNEYANLEEFAKALHQSKTQFFIELLKTGKIPLRSGVKRLLKEAHDAGIRLAIATTTTYENVTTLLEQTLGAEVISWFDVIAAGDVVPNKKPAADIYEYALQEINLAAADCMAFEDSYNGLSSSVAAKLDTVIVVNGYTYQHDFTGSMIVLDNFGEPDRKFTVIDGDAMGARFVDLAFLNQLHDRSK